MRSLLYVANTTATNIDADASIPFNRIIRRYGPLVNLTGNDVYANAGNCGAYARVTVNITYTAAAGDIIFSLQQNDVTIIGAVAEQTVTASAYTTVTLDAIVRLYRSDEINKLSVVTDSAITIANATMIVEVY